MVFRTVYYKSRTILVAYGPFKTEESVDTFVKYVTSGIITTFLNLAILVVLTEWMHVHYLISSAIATESGTLASFVINDLWTFGKEYKKYSLTRRIVQFHGVVMIGVLLTYTTLLILTQWLGIYYLIANMIGIAIGFLWNYSMNVRTTFQKSINIEKPKEG